MICENTDKYSINTRLQREWKWQKLKDGREKDMRTTKKDGKLLIELEERIDSANAAEKEQEIMDVISVNDGVDVVFDAERLTYISSAGLRVLMKVRKRCGKPV